MEPVLTAAHTMRRAIDVCGSLAALIVLSPVFLVVGLLVALTDGFPILFRQTRVGRNGRPFLILKFRSMRNDIEQRDAGGQKITAGGDPRITSLGLWLRKFKLDELPQFINVLRGDMSLIGPRPEVPDYVQFDDPLWRQVLRTRPGITDLASLAYRDEEQLLSPWADRDAYYRSVILPAKLRLNLLYISSRSFFSDFRLLWLTAVYSVRPRAFDRNRILRSFTGRQDLASN